MHVTAKSIARWVSLASVLLVAAVLAASVASAQTSANKPGPLAGLIKQSKGESGIVV